jgi:hypothetical protein
MEKTERKSLRKRSPAYPVIGLKEAVSKAKDLYDEGKGHPIPKEGAFKVLGYETGGGYAGRVTAALKHFGLTTENQGDIILTQEAVDLALHEPTDANYRAIIKKIALKPETYSKIYNRYNGEIPSDKILKITLIKELGFNDDKVTKFTNDFRNTIAFAGLSEAIREEEEFSEREDVNMQEDIPLQADRKRKIQKAFAIPILFKDGKKAELSFSELPITIEDLEMVKNVIDLYSPSLTQDNPTEED